MKKRYIVVALIVTEILAWPAGAVILDKVRYTTPERLAVVKLPPQPGLSRYVVTSEGLFSIVAKDTNTQFNIRINDAGFINGNEFGENAQLPGVKTQCTKTTRAEPEIIYSATDKTALYDGPILTQAVIIDIHHGTNTSPEFDIIRSKDAAKLASAQSC